MVKKALRLLSILAVAVYSLWIGIQVAGARRLVLPDEGNDPREVLGVYHVHTKFSDGRRSLQSVAAAAAGQGLDFVILADHGNPNRRALAAQGWTEGVLVLSGSELSVSRGHLVALDIGADSGPFSQNAETAEAEIRAAGGFSVVAHPYSRVAWSWGLPAGYSGLEIISAYSTLKERTWCLFPYWPCLLLKPSLILQKMLGRPENNLRKWDEMSRTAAVYGYFSVDAHLLYKSLFGFLRLHALLDEPLSPLPNSARRQVFEALRRGRFYNSVSAAAQANGFRFWAFVGGETAPMGSVLSYRPGLTLRVEAPFPYRKSVVLIEDGRPILRSAEETLNHPVRGPAVYRVEVYLEGRTPLPEGVPWIVSNPIFVRGKE